MQASIILTNCVSLRQNRFMAWVSICSNWEGATGRLAGKAPPGRRRYKSFTENRGSARWPRITLVTPRRYLAFSCSPVSPRLSESGDFSWRRKTLNPALAANHEFQRQTHSRIRLNRDSFRGDPFACPEQGLLRLVDDQRLSFPRAI